MSEMRISVPAWAGFPVCLWLLSACGGGGDPATAAAAPGASAAAVAPPAASAPAAAAGDPRPAAAAPEAPAPGTPAAAPAEPPPTAAVAVVAAPSVAPATVATDAQRAAAATATAQGSANLCAAVRPFYWEIGNRDTRLASGSVNAVGNAQTYTASEPMNIASASKWVYGAYVAQARAGQLSDGDRKFLSMRAGYVSLSACDAAQTVDGCLASKGNGSYTPAADGKFQYNGGHMEKHASLNGLGAMGNQALAAAVQAQVGQDVVLAYTRPQPAGGLTMSADAYAAMLRKMLAGTLHMGALLGSDTVCTNPATCGYDKALFTPSPAGESWQYSVAHWVESDPVVGDGAFSSGGAFGFYPWIDATKTHYGIVARVAADGGFPSVQCGRLIRKAWATGLPQT